MHKDVSLCDFNSNHLELLRRWLLQPHVLHWFPEHEADLERALAPMHESGHALIEFCGRPVGYIRWQLVSRALLDSVGLHEVPGNSADIDILIGEKDFTSQGIGTAALALLEARLRDQGGIPMLALTSSTDNVLAHRAFSRAGFTKTGEYSPEGFGKCYLFTRKLS